MIWIECRHDEAIPEELYYDGYQTDKNSNGQTPLMMWIEERHSEDIPEDFYYDGYRTDKDNNE